MVKKLVATFMFLIVLLIGCRSANDPLPNELTISAASSLQESLTEIKNIYEKDYPGVKIHLNFGSSGTLFKQIEQGAPVDLYFTAEPSYMEMLVKEKLVDADSQKDVLTNQLVFISSKASQLSFGDIQNARVKKVAIGQPDTVPAGRYAKETLESLQLWVPLHDRLVFAKDVRQVLSYIEYEEVEVGIVYMTDALTSNQVRIISASEEAWHSPIRYNVGIMKDTKNREAASSFYQFFEEKKAKDIFLKYGFSLAN